MSPDRVAYPTERGEQVGVQDNGVHFMGDDPRDQFSEACGLIGPLRVRVEGPGPQGLSVYEFRRPFCLVGRNPLSDVPIDRPEVSRRHAYFQVVAGRVFCVDLCSRTGVHWGDGARSVGWVDRGRGIDIGPARVRFEGDDSDRGGQGGHLPISRSFDGPTSPDARLEFFGPQSGREPWQVSRAIVLLGRSPICRVRLSGHQVGRVHAAVVRTPGGIWAVDLHGPEGLLVGGVPVECARLEDGDEITLGDQRLRIRVGPAAVRTSAGSNLARRTSGSAVRAVGNDANCSTSRPSEGLDELGKREGTQSAVDPMMARLLDEFDRMHRRTTEQFQQAILMMFRMHQDQMEVIRDELSRLDRLEDEHKALRAEMARGKLPGPPRIALRLVSGGPLPANPRSEVPGPPRGRPEPAEAPGRGPSIVIPPDSPTPGEEPPPSANRRTTSAPPPPSDPDPHATLARRIAEIHEERQGLWKRILASLSGDVSDRDVP